MTTEDKTLQKYLDDPMLHIRELVKLRERVKVRILGEEDPESRGEFEFLLGRTQDKIREVQNKVL